MKFILTFTLLVVYASAAIIRKQDWNEYKRKHSKVYETEFEDSNRKAIWEKNLKIVAKHNKEAENGMHTYKLGMNQFADMTNEEFVAKMNGFKSEMKKPSNNIFVKPSNFKAPDSVDWRKKGFVTPVKDQGQCGSCWAFSTVASLEGQHFNATKKLVSLSEQNLVDCSADQGNQGCDGGLMDQGFQYIIDNHGIDTEKSYPYKAVDEKCKFKKQNVGATLSSFVDVESGNEDALKDAIASVGPISVAIDASQDSFQLYKSGIYNEPACSSSQLDHGVTAVGYGSNSDGDFYIVKNSWNTVWGMDGYILMSRNKDNQCGIATSASFPLV